MGCFANVNYWPLDPEREHFLLPYDPTVQPEDCSLIIVSDDWFRTGQPFPEPVTRGIPGACCIALDRDDGTRLRTLGKPFQAFDLILRTHYNASTRYSGNFSPWAYGLSERVVEATREELVAPERQSSLLANWRHTKYPHSMRLAVERELLPRLREIMPIDEARENIDEPPESPRDRLWWRETGRRHWPAYYRRLTSSLACAAFGGFFETPWPAAKESLVSRLLKRTLTMTHARTHLISQWDSWRLWESFAAGCATFHVDLDRYGCVLPVMPTNWEHYIGFDLDDPGPGLARIRDDPGLLARIGTAGRAWALEHYSPAATARRLLASVRGGTL